MAYSHNDSGAETGSDSCFRPLEVLITFFGWTAQASVGYCGSVSLQVSSY